MDIDAAPKAELHRHLDGIIDPDIAASIRCLHPTYPIDPDELIRAYPVDGFESFLDWWNFTEPISGHLDFFAPILVQHIERLTKQSVRYAEIMIGASEIPENHDEAVGAVSRFRQSVGTAHNIQLEFLIAFSRTKSPERVAQIAEKTIALLDAGLVAGVALAGPEENHPVKPFANTFSRLFEAGVGIEIHAGEWCGPESVWDALKYGQPDRIGHAVAAFDDNGLLDEIAKRGIHLEMCPTSNLETGSLKRIEDHPVRRA
ncbi:MAG: hypothetical protein QGH20_10750, partial [Candidatus Latescibacteria bacterium]|nr:hypothetical protein [Candidatus Latescibacterota bacterium]